MTDNSNTGQTTSQQELFDFTIEYQKGVQTQTVWYGPMTREQLKRRIDRMKKKGWTTTGVPIVSIKYNPQFKNKTDEQAPE